MFTKAEKNYYIDLALAIASSVCMFSGFMLIREEIFQSMVFYIDRVHTISGVVMTGLVVIHIVTHTRWIKALSKSILQNKGKILVLVITIFLSIGIYMVVIGMDPERGDSSSKDRHRISPTGVILPPGVILPEYAGEDPKERDRRFLGENDDE